MSKRHPRMGHEPHSVLDSTLDTGHVCERLFIADEEVTRIAFRLEEEAYWKRFHHSIKTDLASRRKRVTLPKLRFMD